jgi:DNA-binding MarR family transcriptional regulator
MSKSKTPASSGTQDDVTTKIMLTQNTMTKSAKVLALLQRQQGGTLAELVDATGWQPHTTRAMLTGLRKKGHAIERRRRGDATCYHLPVTDA